MDRPIARRNYHIYGHRNDHGNGHIERSVLLSLNSSIGGSELCLPISTKHLKFAHLAPPGQTPSLANGLAAFNDISFEVQPGATCTSDGVVVTERGYCSFSLMLESGFINFDATAPIVMVHGINATESWFDDFTIPFKEADMPVAAIVFRGDLPIQEGGKAVAQKTWEAARQFGARHVHIVAHSKGGSGVASF